MFAGPNGSGKSTLIRKLREKISFGVYINADDIEEEIKKSQFIDLEKYNLKLDNSHWLQYLSQQPSIFSNVPPEVIENIKINQNFIVGLSQNSTSYLSAGIADFLRNELFRARKSFTFETVMSHPSKIELLKQLKENGYRTYLYFVATESEEINIGRVKTRVKKGGHAVSSDKIKERYSKSLALLYQAIKTTDRSYIFDNSGQTPLFVAEITNGKDVEIKEDSIPVWFDKYVLQGRSNQY